MTERDRVVIETKIQDEEEALRVRGRCFELIELPMKATDYVFERDELATNLCRLYLYDNTANSYMWEVLEMLALYHTSCVENGGLALALRSFECFLDRNGKTLEKQLSYCEREHFTQYYKDVYPFRLRANILRGENNLDGNLIEISWGFYKILVECGQSLADGYNDDEVAEQINNGGYSAIVITHPHPDHNGLLSKVSKNIPIYMGEKSIELYKLKNPCDDVSNFRPYHDGIRQTVMDFYKYPMVTPILCDHSTFDSYMLLFESDKEKILYSGDFRSNGNKNFGKLLSCLPKNIDTLITEGTNLHSTQKFANEKEIREEMETVMKGDGPVFVLTSSQNIDRIVGAYKASVKTGRDFYVNLYQAEILRLLGGNVPNPKTFDNVKIVYPQGTRNGIGKYFYYKNKSVSVKELANVQKFTMLITTRDFGYLRKMKTLNPDIYENATLIYSLWTGYKDREDMKNFLARIDELGIKQTVIHTSGHADKNAVKKLIETTHPSDIKYVHVK